MGLAGRECLPVFSFGKEAEMFLKLSGLEEWEDRITGAGELLSMLFGDLRGAERVALNPLPEKISESETMSGLVDVSPKRFMDSLLTLAPTLSP